MFRAAVRWIVAGVLTAAMLPVVQTTASVQPLSLERILAAPPTVDYTELLPTTPGVLEGPFDAAGYSAIGNQGSAMKTLNTLRNDGFISGFGKAWLQASSHRVMVEIIVAFSGGKGAQSWLKQSQEADRADPTYQHALTIDGIDSYYGARMSDLARYFADAYLFVKGNDGFLVSTISDTDSLGDSAAEQTRVQWLKAPAYTIPPSGWPGAPKPLFSAENVRGIVDRASIVLVPAAIVAALSAMVAVRRRRRRQP
jgi:hypothetical protein